MSKSWDETGRKLESIFDEWLNEGYIRQWLTCYLTFKKDNYIITIDTKDWTAMAHEIVFDDNNSDYHFMTYEELDRVCRTIKALKEDREANV